MSRINDILKRVRAIEIKTRGLTRQVFSGDYKSTFKGRGMSFSEVREYQYGDDIRMIDWNVTARNGTPYVKVFEEDRELIINVMIDVTASMGFGTQSMLKADAAIELAALFALSAVKNSDNCGMMLFGQEVEEFIPPRKGRKHALRVIRELLDRPADTRKTNLTQPFNFLHNVMKKRTITFVISDFISPPDYLESLKKAAARHDIVALHLYDKREVDLPNVGFMKLTDAERGNSVWVDSASKHVREAHKEAFEKRQHDTMQLFARAGCDYLPLEIGSNYAATLRSFFKRRAF